jgi:PII interaction protein X
MDENYLSHPTFGLLYSLCSIGERQGLFTTLYAQRLFFRVSISLAEASLSNGATSSDLIFDPISRNEARQLVEEQMRALRRNNRKDELDSLQVIYRQTFT